MRGERTAVEVHRVGDMPREHAGAAMAFSAVFVVTSSLRLRRFRLSPAVPAG